MNRPDIRAAVDVALAQKGYPPGWYWWPAWGRGGRLYVLVEPDAPAGTEGIKVYRLPAPMPRWRFREVIETIPRHGPARFPRPKLTVESLRQPSFCALRSEPAPRKLRGDAGNGVRTGATGPGGSSVRPKRGVRQRRAGAV